MLAIAVSQSGRTPEIVAVLEHSRTCGARTVAVTNDASSPLAHAADVIVELMAGHEIAVPSTKTFTASIAAFAYIAGRRRHRSVRLRRRIAVAMRR